MHLIQEECWKRVREEGRKKKEKNRKRKEKERKKKKSKRRLERVIDELILIQKNRTVAGALQKRKKRWKKLRVPKEVWSYLEEGVPLLFQGRQRPKPRIIKTIRVGTEAEKKLGEYVQEQLSLGFIEETKRAPKIVSPIFAIPKQEPGKWRVILDLRYVNKSQKVPRFRQEGLETLDSMINPGDYLVKGDLKHGFHHLKMKNDHCDYLGFQYQGRWF